MNVALAANKDTITVTLGVEGGTGEEVIAYMTSDDYNLGMDNWYKQSSLTGSSGTTIRIWKNIQIKAVIVDNASDKNPMGDGKWVDYVSNYRVDKVKFLPNGGTFINEVSVTLSTDTVGTEIYYTTDGTSPNKNSSLYESSTPVKITASGALKAVAFKEGNGFSEEA